MITKITKGYFDTKPFDELAITDDAIYLLSAKCEKLVSGNVTGRVKIRKTSRDGECVYWTIATPRIFRNFIIIDGNISSGFRDTLETKLKDEANGTFQDDKDVVMRLCNKLDSEVMQRYRAV